MTTITAADVKAAESAWCNALTQYGPNNMATDRAEMAYHKLNDSRVELVAINKRLSETRAEMKAKGIRRLSMMNGGHTSESMRLNEEMFRLETIKKSLFA